MCPIKPTHRLMNVLLNVSTNKEQLLEKEILRAELK